VSVSWSTGVERAAGHIARQPTDSLVTLTGQNSVVTVSAQAASVASHGLRHRLDPRTAGGIDPEDMSQESDPIQLLVHCRRFFRRVDPAGTTDGDETDRDEGAVRQVCFDVHLATESDDA